MANISWGALCEPGQTVEESQAYLREDQAPETFDSIERQRGLNLARDVLQ